MKLFNHRSPTLLTTICSSLLGLLGFSCSSPEDIPDMYGQPVGDFEVKGAVTDEEGHPVVNAEIRATDPSAPSGLFSYANTKTDDEGRYELSGSCYTGSLKLVCIPTRTGFVPDSIGIKLDFKDPHKDHSWGDMGDAKETINFILKSNSTSKE